MATHHLDIIEKEEYHFPRLPTDDADLNLFRVGHERWGPEMRIHGYAKDRQVIIYVVRGKARFLTERGYVDVGSSMALLFGGSSEFDISTNGHEMELYIIPSRGPAPQGLFKSILGTDLAAYQLEKPFEIQALMEGLFSEARSRTRHAHDICAHYLQIILRKIANDRIQRNTRASRTLESFNKCRGFIESKFGELHSIAEVAEACGLTQAYLTRLFKRYEKTSPYEYLTRLKLNKATQLLLTTSMTVHEIAAELAYDDPYTFSRAFKRVIGVSPAHYRGADAKSGD